MTDTERRWHDLRHTGSARAPDERGIAALELALVLPILLVLAFAVIDLGRFIQARIVVANVAREGGSIGARVSLDSASPPYFAGLLTMLMSASSGLNLQADGRIYISKITAGKTSAAPDPQLTVQESSGLLGAATTVTPTKFGLSDTIYNHLKYRYQAIDGNVTADIGEVTVVEVFYKYTPITPISMFVPGLLTGGREIIASKAVF